MVKVDHTKPLGDGGEKTIKQLVEEDEKKGADYKSATRKESLGKHQKKK